MNAGCGVFIVVVYIMFLAFCFTVVQYRSMKFGIYAYLIIPENIQCLVNTYTSELLYNNYSFTTG